jgi:hypothetical protein
MNPGQPEHPMNEKTAPRPTADPIRTYAERLAEEAEERLQKRQLILAAQCSIENPPDVRIKAWEKAHDVCLPSDPGHAVLPGIAMCTGLTIAQIQEEQRARRARRAASGQNRGPSSNG